MSRSRAFRRWTGTALLAAVVGVGAAGCIAVPVGGYGEPAVGVAAPGVVIAPGPIVVGPGYRRGYYRGYYGRGYYGRYGYRGWRG
jgi:hypothetical protein